MKDTDSEVLSRLQLWYSSQCNGQWEHTNGISIDSLDNPGWWLKVDLADTYLSGLVFDEISGDDVDGKDWYVHKVNNNVFEAFCGQNGLRDAIVAFLRWADDAKE